MGQDLGDPGGSAKICGVYMLAEKIRRLYPDAGLSLYQSGEELLRTDRQPDILFLDIQMVGKDGMETARELPRRK